MSSGKAPTTVERVRGVLAAHGARFERLMSRKKPEPKKTLSGIELRQHSFQPGKPVSKKKRKHGAFSFSSLASFSYVRFSVKEQTLFAKRMSFLVKAGVPLLECLHLIRQQTRSRGKVRVFDRIIKDVESGQFLSTSLRRFGSLFGDFAINIIQVGESGGILSQNLSYLADELHKRYLLRKKVLGALVYPVFITFATLGITGLLTVFIFPKILPIFSSLNVTLPWTTRALITISNFLRVDGLYLILGLVVFFVAFFIARRKIPALRFWTDRLTIAIPFSGSISRNYNLSNFCRTLGLLLRSGMHLSESIAITAETTNNRVYRREFAHIADAVTVGGTMSAELNKNHRLFPDVLPHMIMIGENTGNLSNTLIYLSELYETEVDELTKNLSSSIEPVLMIVMGLLVGIIAVSVIMPIYEITQHLQPR